MSGRGNSGDRPDRVKSRSRHHRLPATGGRFLHSQAGGVSKFQRSYASSKSGLDTYKAEHGHARSNLISEGMLGFSS
jgi:hypothetical protein